MNPPRQRCFSKMCQADANRCRAKDWKRKAYWLAVRNKWLATFKRIKRK